MGICGLQKAAVEAWALFPGRAPGRCPEKRCCRQSLDGLTGKDFGVPQEDREVEERGRSCGHITRNKNYGKVSGHGPGTRSEPMHGPAQPSPIPETFGATFMSELSVDAHCMSYDEQVFACCMN